METAAAPAPRVLRHAQSGKRVRRAAAFDQQFDPNEPRPVSAPKEFEWHVDHEALQVHFEWLQKLPGKPNAGCHGHSLARSRRRCRHRTKRLNPNKTEVAYMQFPGAPVCCAAGMAAMNVLLEEELVTGVTEKEILFRTLLHHPKIEAVRSRGLMMAVVFDSFETNKKVIDACIAKGVITDWFLFCNNCPIILWE